jgi:hypothetical protein
VADGGGECALENYRLLCRACHLAVTSRWRAGRVEHPRPDASRLSSARLDGRSNARSCDEAAEPTSPRRLPLSMPRSFRPG